MAEQASLNGRDNTRRAEETNKGKRAQREQKNEPERREERTHCVTRSKTSTKRCETKHNKDTRVIVSLMCDRREHFSACLCDGGIRTKQRREKESNRQKDEERKIGREERGETTPVGKSYEDPTLYERSTYGKRVGGHYE